MSVYFIAEAGVNHNGSLKLAKELVDIAKVAGADAVKFQTFIAEQVVTPTAKKAEYQITNTGNSDSQLEMIKKLELSQADFRQIRDYCQLRGIEFLSTPFDISSAHFLNSSLEVQKMKVPSGEITNASLLLTIARFRKPIILSTGMSDLEEIEEALATIAYGLVHDDFPTSVRARSFFKTDSAKKILEKYVTILHCVTEYPAPERDINLRAMQAIRARFGLPIGYSDHSLGIHIPIAAVAMGATVIEKHFTIDTKMDGPDHACSLSPAELKLLVDLIRKVELSFGNGEKKPAQSELKNREIVRRSLFAAKEIRSGEIFSEKNMIALRPGSGISAKHFYDWIGRKASRDFSAGEMISE